jgi:nitrogen-specific signal transduction histidine kinase
MIICRAFNNLVNFLLKRLVSTLLKDEIPFVFFECDFSYPWKFTYLSKNIYKLIGVNNKDIVKNRYLYQSMIIETDIDYVLESINESLNGIKQYIVEYRISNKNNQVIWLREHGRITRKFKKNKIEGYIYDISSEKKIKDYIAKSVLCKSSLLLIEGYCHDIKNSLTGALGNLDLFLLENDNRNIKLKKIKKIKSSLSYISSVTKDISNCIVDECQTQQEEFYVSSLLYKSISLCSIDKSKVNLVLSVDNTDKIKVMGLESEFISVFTNVIQNSLQSMNDKKNSDCRHTLSIKLSGYIKFETSRNTQYCCIEVKDEGVGIDEDNVIKVFDMFYTTKKNGTGIGLPVVEHILKKRNGFIVVSSIVGIGTKFKIYLPISYQ